MVKSCCKVFCLFIELGYVSLTHSVVIIASVLFEKSIILSELLTELTLALSEFTLADLVLLTLLAGGCAESSISVVIIVYLAYVRERRLSVLILIILVHILLEDLGKLLHTSALKNVIRKCSRGSCYLVKRDLFKLLCIAVISVNVALKLIFTGSNVSAKHLRCSKALGVKIKNASLIFSASCKGVELLLFSLSILIFFFGFGKLLFDVVNNLVVVLDLLLESTLVKTVEGREKSKCTNTCRLACGHTHNLGFILAIGICNKCIIAVCIGSYNSTCSSLTSGNVVNDMLGIGNFINNASNYIIIVERYSEIGFLCDRAFGGVSICIGGFGDSLISSLFINEEVLLFTCFGNGGFVLSSAFCDRRFRLFTINLNGAFNIFNLDNIFSLGIHSLSFFKLLGSHKGRLVLRGIRRILYHLGRRGYVSCGKSLIKLILSTAELIDVFLKKLSVFFKKLCNFAISGCIGSIIVSNALVGDIFVVNVAIIVNINNRSNRCDNVLLIISLWFFGLWSRLLCCRLFRHSYSFFRSSYGLLWFSLFLLLGLSLRSGRSRRHGHIELHRFRPFKFRYYGLFYRCWLGLGIFRDLAICNVVNLVGKNHVFGFFLGLTFGFFVFIGKTHAIVRFFIITVKIIRVDGKGHINRLFLFFGLFCRSFFLYGLFCYRLFNSRLLCYRLISNSFLYGFLCYRLFNSRFLCYRLFYRSIFSLLLCLLVCKALFYLVKEVSCGCGSLSCLFLFLFNCFLECSLTLFLLSCDSSFFLCLFTLLSRSHRTLLCILFQLVSVVFGILKGRLPFFVQAFGLFLASFARITVSVITLTCFGIIATEWNAIFPYVHCGIWRILFHCISLII